MKMFRASQTTELANRMAEFLNTILPATAQQAVLIPISTSMGSAEPRSTSSLVRRRRYERRTSMAKSTNLRSTWF